MNVLEFFNKSGRIGSIINLFSTWESSDNKKGTFS